MVQTLLPVVYFPEKSPQEDVQTSWKPGDCECMGLCVAWMWVWSMLGSTENVMNTRTLKKKTIIIYVFGIFVSMKIFIYLKLAKLNIFFNFYIVSSFLYYIILKT